MHPAPDICMLDILRYNPQSCDFPPPAIPLLPPPGRPGWYRSHAGLGTRATAGARRFRHFARGRYALHEAFRLVGVQRGRTVLAPSYHCRTMLDPALALGADVGLYGLHANLDPDLEAVDAARRRSTSPVRALLATHFFGHARDLKPLAAWCKQHGIELIEDCAHGFVLDPADGHPGPAAGQMGITGRIGISSPYKFTGSADGGLLWVDAGTDAPAGANRAPSWADEARGGLGLWRRWRAARSGAPAAPAHFESPSDAAPCGRSTYVRSSEPSAHYNWQFVGRGRLRSSGWLVRHTDAEAVAMARRVRYAQWVQAAATFPGARAFMQLDGATVPYMFPLQVAVAEPAFTRLKRAGLPIWRWDDMAVSECRVATGLREHLLHLPCHQGLRDLDMDWMIETLQRTLSTCK